MTATTTTDEILRQLTEDERLEFARRCFREGDMPNAASELVGWITPQSQRVHDDWTDQLTLAGTQAARSAMAARLVELIAARNGYDR